jgi:hypothetical protein
MSQQNSKEIRIPYSIWKIVLALTGSLAFVFAGFWILFSDEGLSSSLFPIEVINRTIGIISIVFFGTVSVTIPWKLCKNKMGVIIDEHGITDRSNLSSIGLIEWDDITAIGTISDIKTSVLLIHTDKPEKYLDKAKNKFKRHLLSANHKKYKTPLSITSMILGVRFKELEKLVVDAFEKKKSEALNS